MKKFTLIILLFMASYVTKAQTGSVQYGLQAGTNIADFKGEGTSDIKSRIAFNAGLLMLYKLNPSLALNLSLLYGGHGGKEGPSTYAFSSIFLPVLASLMIYHFNLYLGPQISYLLSAKAKSSGGETDIKDNYKSLNTAAVAGLGYMFNQNLGLTAKYSLGLGNIHKSATAANVQHTIFMINLIWLLSKK